MTAQDDLREAAALVARALAQLDTTQRQPCDACGSKRFTNVVEVRIYESLAGTADKLRAAADKLG